jgi:uronate dehydrogenase
MKHVVLTGAAGSVARQIVPLLKGVYDPLVLSDRVRPPQLAPGERFVAADLTDLAAVERAVSGAEGIIHLGGFSVEGDWETIQQANIVGCHNLFEAARRQGVQRVVFASSNHAIGFYRRSHRIGVDDRVRPDTRYGLSKAFGEALGSLYADKYGLRVLSIRIGNVADAPADLRRLSIWLHPEDLVQLIRIGLEHPAVRNEVLFGASDNARGWWDTRAAQRLGYRPRHRAEDHLARALAEQARLPADPLGDLFQGGGFCAQEFSAPWPPEE